MVRPSYRVWLTATAGDRLTLDAADANGAPVISVGSLARREESLSSTSPGAAVRDSLFSVTWIPVTADALSAAAPVRLDPGAPAQRAAVIGPDPLNLAAGLAAAVSVGTHPGLAELVAAVRAGAPVPDAVLVSAVGDVPETASAADPGEAARRAVGQVLLLVQQWLATAELATARLVVVTSGAVTAVAGDTVTDLAGAAVCGLVRSAQSEDPGRIVLADLPAGIADAAVAVALLPAALLTGEPELAIRGQASYARRLARPEPAAITAEHAEHWLPDAGTVLVTGGTGGLGGLVARHVAGEGSPGRVTLLSRSGPAAPGAAELAASVADSGAVAQIVACDATDRPALAALIAGVPAECPLTAVIHTAGVLYDGVISSLTPAGIDTVMRPKADAAWHLHELTASARLRSFIVFSSAAAIFGSAGQGNYAAANAFLDGLAGYRHAAGLPATSLAWGLWDDTAGMGSRLAAGHRSRIDRATGALAPREGLALLDLACGRDDAVLVPTKLGLAALRAAARAGMTMPPLLSHLVPVPRRAAQAGAGSSARALRERLAGADEAAQGQIIADLVRGSAAAVLGHSSADAIGLETTFPEQGFDSLTAIELRNQLAAVTGLGLPATLVFDYPTPAAMAGYLRGQLADSHGSGDEEIEDGDGEIRELLSSIPVDLLRSSGLLDSLMELAGVNGHQVPADANSDNIKEMSAEDLIKTAQSISDEHSALWDEEVGDDSGY